MNRGLRKRSGGGMFGAVPSNEVRNMKKSFERAIRMAVEVANCKHKIVQMIEDEEVSLRKDKRESGGSDHQKC